MLLQYQRAAEQPPNKSWTPYRCKMYFVDRLQYTLRNQRMHAPSLALSLSLSLSISLYLSLSISLYIYIKRERENEIYRCMYRYYVYIYICTYR